MGSGSFRFEVAAGASGRRLRASLAAAVLAWPSVVLMTRSPAATYLSHDVLDRAGVPLPVAVVGYAAGWLLMVAAMMLPVALLVEGPARGRGRWLAGYLGAWLAAGFVFAWVDLLLHAVVGTSDGWPVTHLRGCVVVGGAGLSLLLVWREAARHASVASHGTSGFAWGHGWLHGLLCVRTCGPMMLALQAGAPGDLGAMALATACLASVRLGVWTRQFGSAPALRTASRSNSFSPSRALGSTREGETHAERRGDVPVGPS